MLFVGKVHNIIIAAIVFMNVSYWFIDLHIGIAIGHERNINTTTYVCIQLKFTGEWNSQIKLK